MILFKPEHVDLILEGRKTQTRRTGKKRWNVGAVHQCKTQMFGEPFAKVLILGVREERLGKISWEDICREGYGWRGDYKEAWERIYKTPWDDDLEVWVVDFRLMMTHDNEAGWVGVERRR